jgi:DNA-binding XRE family transcriptional regulator
MDVTPAPTDSDRDVDPDSLPDADSGDIEPMAVYAKVVRILEGLPLLLEHTRRYRGLTFEDAARELGISPKHLMRLERDDANPNKNTVVAILKWVSK